MTPLLLAAAAAGLVIAAVSTVALRLSGAHPGIGRRLAGVPGVSVGDLVEGSTPVDRPVRVSGRIRCGDAIRAEGGERLVARHDDVELRVRGRWHGIERVRETRSFELWDRGGSLALDPAQAAEPLIVIPKVWRGSPEKLPEPLASAARRLEERAGPADEARSVTRSINVTDELEVLAVPRRDAGGRARLEPPPGGYLITNLALPDAMRLLGGRHRRVAALAVIGIGLGVVVAVIGAMAALLAGLLG